MTVLFMYALFSQQPATPLNHGLHSATSQLIRFGDTARAAGGPHYPVLGISYRWRAPADLAARPSSYCFAFDASLERNMVEQVASRMAFRRACWCLHV